jgi:hypothetical protein
MYQPLRLPILVNLLVVKLRWTYPRVADNVAFPDTRVMTFDAHKWFSRVLDSPEPFGFTNTTGCVPLLFIFGWSLSDAFPFASCS